MACKQNQKLNVKQRLSCAVGTVFNDLYRQLGMSFAVSFLMKVAGLPPSEVGAALLIQQGTDALFSPISGHLGDHVKIPFLSNKMGRRKSWHFTGAILLAVGTPLLFNRCLLCSENTKETWQPLVYYGFPLVLIAVGYNIMEINHLAIISAVTDTFRELTAVNSLRTVFSFLSGIYIYLIAWGLLGQESGDDLTPNNLTQFERLSLIATGTGVMFSIIFYIGTKEPEAIRSLRKNIGGLFSAEIKGESVTLAQKFVEMLLSPSKSQESLNDSRDETETETAERKRDWVKRFVDAVFTPGTNESHFDDSAGEHELAEVKAESTIEGPADLVRKMVKLNQEGKKSLVMRFLGGLVDAIYHNQPNKKDTIQGDENKDVENERNEAGCSKYYQQGDNESNSVERMKKGGEIVLETDPKEGNGMTTRQRRKGAAISFEEISELGMNNLGYQNHATEVEVHDMPNSEADSVNNNQFPTEGDISSMKNPKDRKVSFFQEQHGFERLNEDVDFFKETSHTELSSSAEKKSPKRKDSIVDDHNEVKTETDVGHESTKAKCTPKRKPKTLKDWSMNPHLYKVAVIVTCSRLVQDAVYAYLPLYLTETLGFAVQAIAYFPLVLLGSAALASTVTEKLNTRIGSKWTYILASLFVIGGSVNCFFQTPALRQSTYAPVIMMGSGMSIMYVMSLSFATEVVGQDKATSGSGLSVIVIIARLSSGALFMIIQEFYPEDDSESNVKAVSEYMRYVISVIPGLLALTGFLVVFLFQPSAPCCVTKESFELPVKEL